MTKHQKKNVAHRGRPSLSGQSRKTPQRSLRVDDMRWERWRAAAARKGQTLADWIRDTLDAAA